MAKNILGLALLKFTTYNKLLNERESFEGKSEQLQKELSENKKDLKKAERKKDLAVREIKEYQALADSYLEDQKKVKAQYAEISRILQESIKNGAGLSKLENLVINEDFRPLICCTPYDDKLKYGSYHYSHPKGNEKFMQKIAKNPYVTEVRRRRNKRKITISQLRKLPKDKEGFKFEAIYVNGYGMSIEIVTTATNEVQQDFVYRLLKRELKINH